jgi:hypothetical protein
MAARYCIFKNVRNDAPLQVASVATWGEAEQTLNALAWVESGDYFTVDSTSGEILSGRPLGLNISFPVKDETKKAA